MLEIGRVYFDSCGYQDGVLEEIVLSSLDEAGDPLPHLLHAPNGVGKTTILALLFSVFEPDRRKFLRTEINPQHCLEHYFLPGRLGIVAIELIRQLPDGSDLRYVVGQIFWMTAASKGEDGSPGQRRRFGFQCREGLTFDSLPFRRLGGAPVLKNMDDVLQWIRQMRQAYPSNFFSPLAQTEWAKYLTVEVGIDLRLTAVQRKFCATEGGISTAFLTFKDEAQFLAKVFEYMIPAETAESVIGSLRASLEKIRDLPKRREQLKALTQLRDAFEPFVQEAAAWEAADHSVRAALRRLGELFARLQRELAAVEIKRAELGITIAANVANLERAQRRDARLEGEMLFLESTSAEIRLNDAKVGLQHARESLRLAKRRSRAARAADLSRQMESAGALRDRLQEELERIEKDLAPDRAHLGRVGAEVHACLEQLAIEASFDAQAKKNAADAAGREEALHVEAEGQANTARVTLAGLISRLEQQLEQHRSERAALEMKGILQASELPSAAIERLSQRLTEQADLDAEAELREEELTQRVLASESARDGAEREARAQEELRARLAERVTEGERLEGCVFQCEKLPSILAGDAKDAYRVDLPDRVRGASRALEVLWGREATERDRLAQELKFLDASGVSAVPADVMEVARALTEAGFSDALPAEHYLAEFMPDAERSQALIRSDPAKFTGVFVSKPDITVLARLSRESRLRLTSPVVVSEASLEIAAATPSNDRIVFDPFSAARFNKQAADEERKKIGAQLDLSEQRLREMRSDLDMLTVLEADVRRLQREFGDRRPEELARLRDEAEQMRIESVELAASMRVSLEAIRSERTLLKEKRRQYREPLQRLPAEIRIVEDFAKRHAQIDDIGHRLLSSRAELGQHESSAATARRAANAAREKYNEYSTAATTLTAQAQGWRQRKQFYPESDGLPATPRATLDDLVVLYKSAETILQSKREAQSAGVSLRLETAKAKILHLEPQFTLARKDLTDAEIAAFSDVADLERAIAEAGTSELEWQEKTIRAENVLESAEGRTGPIARKIKDAHDHRGISPVALTEFSDATADECDVARSAREQLRAECAVDIASFTAKAAALRNDDLSLGAQAEGLSDAIQRAQDHLPEENRKELPDLSLQSGELRPTLTYLIEQLRAANAALDGARENMEAAYELARGVAGSEAFRQCEPRVAEHLLRYSITSAAADREPLMTRIAERVEIVTSEVENQQRDQNTCLKLLEQHVGHADDLLRRAVRCSKIPDSAYSYAGERMLKVARTLRDLTPDAVMSQLAIWLDEQAIAGRIPSDGAKLAAELIHRVHAGRKLGIEILKPKRDAIRPYMPVDSMGLSGGEGVTVAMMLYTVIQKMAVDERAEVSGSVSGGFLLLDNPYGASNLLEHVTLQMSLAKTLGIQLFVTTCVEDKNVLNLFPTVSRLVQAEKVHRNGVPQYVRVRAADFVIKESDDAA